MTVKIGVKIELDGEGNVVKVFNEAGDAADKFEKKAKTTQSSWASTITAISTGYLAASEALHHLGEALGEPIKLAIKQETAQFRVAQAMKITGSYTDEAYKSILAYAEETEKLTGIQAEQVQMTIAQNKVFGLTTDQAESLTDAAAKLARHMGTDLESANQILLNSLNGQDRALVKVIPDVKALTEAQLRQGGAIKLVSDRLGDFATADASTTSGALLRLSNGFENLQKHLGQIILSGFKVNGALKPASDAFDQLNDALDKNQATISKLASTGFIAIIKGIVLFANSLTNIGDNFEYIFIQVAKFATSVENAFLKLRIGMNSAGAAMREFIHGEGDSKAQNFRKGMERDQQQIELNNKSIEQYNSSIMDLGNTAEATAKKTEETGSKSFGGKVNLGENREMRTARLAEEAAINAQILDLDKAHNNEVVIEQTQKLAEVDKREREFADKGIKLKSSYDKLRLALDKSYQEKLQDQARQTELAIAQGSGETRRAVEAQYAIDVEKYQIMLDKKLISEEEFENAKVELRRKTDIASRQTTGNAGTDETLGKINSFVGSLSGGLSGIISQIGALFGPLGNLIATLFNLFNQTPAQFRAMIDGLLEAIEKAPQYIVDNIPYIIQKFIEELPKIVVGFVAAIANPAVQINIELAFITGITNAFKTLGNKSFWMSFVNGFKNALEDSLKSIFTGKKYQSEISAATSPVIKQQQQSVAFGSDDPNAGGAEFKIKDLELAGKRKAAGKFEDTFAETVDEGGKSLIQYLKDFFNDLFGGILDRIGEWGTAIWNALNSAAQAIWQWGQMIWNQLWAAGQQIWQFGQMIWTGLFNAVSGSLAWFNGLGQRIFDGLSNALNINGAWLSGLGGQMAGGFANSFGNWFYDRGKDMAKGLMDNISGIAGGSSGGGINIGIPGVASVGTNGVSVGGKRLLNKGGYVDGSLAHPAMARAFVAMGALQFAGGGTVPGTGFSDTVPAVLTPGETVVRRGGSTGDSTVINFTFNVSAGATFDKEAIQRVMPQIIENIRRESKNGANVVRPSGVY